MALLGLPSKHVISMAISAQSPAAPSGGVTAVVSGPVVEVVLPAVIAAATEPAVLFGSGALLRVEAASRLRLEVMGPIFEPGLCKCRSNSGLGGIFLCVTTMIRRRGGRSRLRKRKRLDSWQSSLQWEASHIPHTTLIENSNTTFNRK